MSPGRAPLRIAVAQPVTVAGDVAANARAHASMVRGADARVVVFPEMSLTGYELDAPVVSPDDPRLDPVIAACAETGSIALAGAPVAGDFIAILAIDGGSATVVYRKQWLGGSEPDRFRAGPAPAALDVDGWRLGLAVCRDTGIREHAAATAALGIDAYVAGVLEHEADAAVPGERACRIAGDHGVWVAIASFAGSTGGGYDRAAGGSGIWSPKGTAVARVGPAVGGIARTTLR